MEIYERKSKVETEKPRIGRSKNKTKQSKQQKNKKKTTDKRIYKMNKEKIHTLAPRLQAYCLSLWYRHRTPVNNVTNFPQYSHNYIMK